MFAQKNKILAKREVFLYIESATGCQIAQGQPET